MDDGNAAYRYQILMTTILLTILGIATVFYIHDQIVSKLNEQLKEVAGPYTRKLIKNGLASKHLTLMLIVMIYLGAYFTFMYLYHLVRHYSS